VNNQENPRFAKWLEKYRLFRDESTQKRYSSHTKMRTSRRIRAKDEKWFRFTTQSIRRDITRSLGDLYDTAIRFSNQDVLELSERERWGRLAAYIAQTINTIINSYDSVKIESTLDELQEYVEKNVQRT